MSTQEISVRLQDCIKRLEKARKDYEDLTEAIVNGTIDRKDVLSSIITVDKAYDACEKEYQELRKEAYKLEQQNQE